MHHSKDLYPYLQEQHSETVRRLASLLHEVGGRALLVGGSVRDGLLQLQPRDLDLEVFGLSEVEVTSILAKSMEIEKVGRSFPVWKIKGLPVDVSLPRTERKTGSGHADFHWETAKDMTIEKAAERRDFTINAIFWDPLTLKILDPCGGCEDLSQKKLRHVSDKFSEDSLRVLRGMQLVARFELQAVKETVDLCQKLSQENLSPERFFEEWRKLLLQGSKPSQGLVFLELVGWLRYYPELKAMIDCPQDLRWHPEGSVWKHTLYALDAFAKDRIGDPVEDMIIGLAVLCHDMGKPATTIADKSGVRSPGHEKAGIEPAERFLQRITDSPFWARQVLPLVETHMRPRQLYDQKASPNAVRRLALKVGRLDRLLRLCKADASGRSPKLVGSFPEGEWLLERARHLQVENKKPQPLVMGRDLVALGVQPGPSMGELLSRLFELQLDGVFNSKEEGICIASQLWDKDRS